MGKLNQRTLHALPKGRYGDGEGLYLIVGDGGAKSWMLYVYEDGKRRELGLGSLRSVSLAQARAAAKEKRKALEGSKGTPTRRKRTSGPEIAPVSFSEASEAFLKAKAGPWTPQYARDWQLCLENHAFPVLGKRPVAAIETPDVLEALGLIWAKHPNRARRVRERIEAVLGWAMVAGHRPEGLNPARWHGHLEHALAGKESETPRRAMPWRDVPAFMARLADDDHVASRALAFAILTAARTGEVHGATWGEIAEGCWTIPAARMKMRRGHGVRLSEAADCILRMVEPESRASGRRIFDIGPDAMRRRLRKYDTEHDTHGFRSSFRTWAADQGFPFDVCEMALAHSIGSTVERIYARSDLLARRLELMQAWASFIWPDA